jgi:protein involved in polysaccharide export with SLBB domain
MNNLYCISADSQGLVRKEYGELSPEPMKHSRLVSLLPSSPSLAKTIAQWTGLLILATCPVLTACSSPGLAPSALPASWRTPPSGPVTLNEGDMVKLFFPGAPEFSSSQKVRADGKLSLTGLGEIHAAGKTLLQLQSEISSRYRGQIQNPTVMVTLEASGSPITVTGGVMSPGAKLSPDRTTTLLEALLAAGGVSEEKGDASRVRIVRLINGRGETVTVDMRAALKGTDNSPIYLRAGDNVNVGGY